MACCERVMRFPRAQHLADGIGFAGLLCGLFHGLQGWLYLYDSPYPEERAAAGGTPTAETDMAEPARPICRGRNRA